MILFPNGKVNLGLRVLSKRADGYHEIETVFAPIAMTDVLEVTLAPKGEDIFSIDGLSDPCPLESNLVYRALLAMRRLFPVPPVQVSLIKKIPSQAGLGGGSSDAAFMLRALNELFSLGASASQLHEVACSLGADCPFFLLNSPALATGIGEQLNPIKFPEYWQNIYIAVVKPPISIHTGQAYGCITPNPKAAHTLAPILQQPIETWRGCLCNDFEQVLPIEQKEVIEGIKEFLYNQGAIYTSLSGSGSAVYGLFSAPLEEYSLSRYFPVDYVTWCGRLI